MKALLIRIRILLRSRRNRQLLTRAVSLVAAIVVFVTTYALVLPAITLEQEAYCGILEHQHTDTCYEERLVCEIPEGEDHHHDASCYEKVLVCGQEVHIHSPECYQEDSIAVVSAGSETAAFTDFGTSAEADEIFTEADQTSAEPDGTFTEADQTSAEPDDTFPEADQTSTDSDPFSGDGSEYDADTAAADSYTVADKADDGMEGSAPETVPDDFNNVSDLPEDMDQENPAGAGGFELTEDSGENAADSDLEATETGSSEDTDAGTVDADSMDAEDSEAPGIEAPENMGDEQVSGIETSENMEADTAEQEEAESQNIEEDKDAASDEEGGSQGESVSDENENQFTESENSSDFSSDVNDWSDSVADTSDPAPEEDISDEDGESYESNDFAADTADAGLEDEDTAVWETEDAGSADIAVEDADIAAGETEDAGSADIATEDANTAAGETEDAGSADTETTDADTAAGLEETANEAATDVPAEPVEAEKLSSGYVPQLDSIEFGSVLNKHTDFYYFHAEEGQEIPATSAEVTDWKKVKNGLFGSTKLETDDLVKAYFSYTIPAGALNETNQVARYRLPSNIHLTDDQITAINGTENGMTAIYADAAAKEDQEAADDADDQTHTEEAETDSITGSSHEDSGAASGTDEMDEKNEADEADEAESAADSLDPAQDENAANYQKYLGAEAVEGTRTPDEKLKEGAQEYISAIVKVENVFDDEGLYGEKGAYLGQDLIFIFTPYSIEKNQTTYDADGNPISAGEKITGWFACDFNMSQIDWVEEDTDLDNSTIEKTAEVVFVEKDSDNKVKEISRTLKLVDKTGDQSDTAEGGETAAAAETAAVAETADAAETTAAAETAGTAATAATSAETAATASETAATDEAAKDTEDTEAGSFKSGTLTADGDGYKITLDYTEEAKIPENAELSVREITAETDKEAYEACLEQAGQQVAADDKTSVDRKSSRFFDIEILVKETDSEGKEETRKIEPSASVSVNIQIIEGTEAEDAASVDEKTERNDPAVLHFAEEGVEQIDSTVKTSQEQDDNEVRSGSEDTEPSTEISFEAESFSIYGVVYTVDFHWEVNSKMYEFSLPGGGFVSFSDLIEVLGVAKTGENEENEDQNSGEDGIYLPGEVPGINDQDINGENSDELAREVGNEGIRDNIQVSEDTWEFVRDVEKVEFSNTTLVDVSKVESETTVGQIKEDRGLEVQYSAKLTEEQIAEINAQTVEAGDWALISMIPFESTESLTVTMKTGEVFEIRVTDYQISTNVLTADGKTYKITVTYDDDAEIPAGTKLLANEIEFGSDEYLKHLGQAWTEINKKYLEVEEMRENYDESMGELPDVYCTNINVARFFDISLIFNNEKIEPKAPVQVEIKYVQGLDAPEETTPGVVHYAEEDHVDIINDVETTIKDNEVTEFRYEQDSFSVIGTYVGQETQDQYTEPKLAAGPDPNGNASVRNAGLSDKALEEVILSSLKSSGQLRAGETEQSDENDNTGITKPEAHKSLVPNEDEDGQEDGTYTLTLSVKGHSSVTTETTVKKANVLVVMDRSSSMVTNTIDNNESYWLHDGTEYRSGLNYYGKDGDNYIALNRMTDMFGNFRYFQRTDNYQAYSGDVYVKSKTTRFAGEQEALSNLFTKLLDKNGTTETDKDNVEISVISFADQRYQGKTTEVGWTDGRDTQPLINGITSNQYTSGTNWEDALKYAKEILDAKKTADVNVGKSEDYYVVFLTDGEPTAYYGESGGAHHYGTTGGGFETAYTPARDDAAALVNAGYKLYNIFTYGNDTDNIDYLRRLTNYAYTNGADDSASATTEWVSKYFVDARSTETLVQAFNNIFNTIEDSIGHGNVSITDTLTTDAMTTTVVHGKTNGYVYTVTDPDGDTLYTVTATGDLDNPTVTFNVPGSTTENYTAQSTTVGGKTVYYVTTDEGKVLKMALADISDDTGELVWDLSPVGLLLDNYTYSVNFVVWPDQDAYDYVAALNNGLETITDSSNTTVDVVWNQGSATPVTGSAGTYFKGGCSKYPSIVYYPGAGDNYEKGVYNGTFAVLTNTDQKLHYSVIETTTTNGTTETEITGPFYHELENPDPMPLAHTQSLLYKQWNVDRDPEILLRLLYEFDGEEPVYDENNNLIPTGFTIGFDILQDTNTTPYDTVGLGWNGEDYVWDTSDPDSLKTFEYRGKEYTISTRWMDGFSIATGLMLSGERMDAIGLDRSAYPSGEYTDGEGHTTTYYLLEDGHDYTIKENNVSYEFDFEAPVYHPMLVDGTLRNVNFTKTDNGTTINYTEISPLNINPGTDTSSLEIVNTLRGYIHLNKKVVGSDGATEITDDTTEFEYTVELNNANAPFTIEGSHIPWYGISELYYHDEDGNYYQARPVGSPMENGNPNGPKKYLSLTLETEAGDIYNATCENGFDPNVVGPSVIKYTVGAEEKTIQLYGNQMEPSEETPEGIGEYKRAMATIRITRSQQLNIANVPINTTYKIIETDENGYHLIAIERQTGGGAAVQAGNVGTATITGTIIPNSETNITYTNRCDVITIQKLDGNGNGLEGAVFQIKAVNGLEESLITNVDGIGEVTKVVDGEEKTFKSAFETTGGAQRIAGLPNGTYRLREVYVPAGYISTVSHIDFKIENHVMSMITEDDSLEFVPASASGGNAKLALLKITNTPGATLPNTGGPGTNMIYLLGIMLTGLAGAGLVMRRRRKNVA